MTTIKPTQRDRVAAVAIHQNSRDHDMHRWVSAGKCDADFIVQTLAHHAAAERAIGYRMGIEAAVKVAENESDYTIVTPYVHRGKLVRSIRTLSDNAEAIAQGSQQ